MGIYTPVGFADRAGPHARAREKLLEAEKGLHLTASKEMRTPKQLPTASICLEADSSPEPPDKADLGQHLDFSLWCPKQRTQSEPPKLLTA